MDSPDRLRDTLVHEMCHAASWIISGYKDGHGPIWKNWAHRAENRFPELPVIKRCHSYEIRTKYVYRCQTCGKGRFAKYGIFLVYDSQNRSYPSNILANFYFFLFTDYGRHSKSIDISKKRCGKCRGVLELFVASKVGGKYKKSEGCQKDFEEHKNLLRTPKAPNAFAMFVKDHYKMFRTPGTTHKNAMEALSLQFSQTKINKK